MDVSLNGPQHHLIDCSFSLGVSPMASPVLGNPPGWICLNQWSSWHCRAFSQETHRNTPFMDCFPITMGSIIPHDHQTTGCFLPLLSGAFKEAAPTTCPIRILRQDTMASAASLEVPCHRRCSSHLIVQYRLLDKHLYQPWSIVLYSPISQVDYIITTISQPINHHFSIKNKKLCYPLVI